MGRAALTLFSPSSLINTILSGPEKHIQVVSICYFVAILCICFVVGHLLEKNRWVNESITAILIGFISGTLILLMNKGTSSLILRFNEELFFIYLLPPIIFNAGFQVKKKQFFHNFLPITFFGVVGVFISAAIISAGSWWLFPKVGFTGLEPRDYFALGVIFSSTDTVCTLQVLHQDETPLLYSLVFGEGVVNDATSVVLFNAIQKLDVSHLNGWTAAHISLDFLYLFSTSTVLGVVAGLLTAFATKTLYVGRHSTEREIALMVLMAYLSYMLAEHCHVTLCMAQCEQELENCNQTHICLTVIHRGNIHLYVRGNGCPRHREMENDETKVFGFFTKPLINCLLPHQARDNRHKSGLNSPREDLALPLLNFEESATANLDRAKTSISLLLERPVRTIHFYWRKFDDSYMRPIFEGPDDQTRFMPLQRIFWEGW